MFKISHLKPLLKDHYRALNNKILHNWNISWWQFCNSFYALLFNLSWRNCITWIFHKTTFTLFGELLQFYSKRYIFIFVRRIYTKRYWNIMNKGNNGIRFVSMCKHKIDQSLLLMGKLYPNGQFQMEIGIPWS